MTARHGPRLTDADREAWAGFARHIAPLPGRVRPSGASAAVSTDMMREASPAPPPAARRAEGRARLAAALSPLAVGATPAGLDRATWRRFRTGKLAAARKLDLHGMTAQRAFLALAGFLRAAHAERLRCVEIVTGRGSVGLAGAGEGTGVIRRELPHWLNRPDIRPLVLGAAYPHAANPGAVRVLLRRIR
jgi:DNA-nicking Smr family endonuclease